jgi:hypothetical protein
LIAWIIRGKSLYLIPFRRPWLELAGMSYHSLDSVTPPAALFPIEDHIGYRNLRHRRLTRSLKGYRPDQVVSIFNRLAGQGSRCWVLLCHIFRGKRRRARRCSAPLPAYVATWGGRDVFGGCCQVIGSLPIH